MMCEWGHANPAEWGAELALANSWRTGNDLMPLYPCARTCPSSFSVVTFLMEIRPFVKTGLGQT
jgi:hypothetical protein